MNITKNTYRNKEMTITLKVAAYREEEDSLNFSPMSSSKSVWNESVLYLTVRCTVYMAGFL